MSALRSEGHEKMIRSILTACVIGALLFPANANAELVTYRFSGRLDIDDYVNDPTRWPGVNLGDRFEGTITLDTDPPVYAPGDQGSIIYNGPLPSNVSGGTVRVGEQEFLLSDGSNQNARVRNGIANDMLSLSLSHGFAEGNQPGIEYFGFTFTDSDGEAFSNNSFPALLDFTKFEQAELNVTRIVDSRPLPSFLLQLNLRGTIESFAVVPEPGTWLLALVASMLLVFFVAIRRPILKE